MGRACVRHCQGDKGQGDEAEYDQEQARVSHIPRIQPWSTGGAMQVLLLLLTTGGRSAVRLAPTALRADIQQPQNDDGDDQYD